MDSVRDFEDMLALLHQHRVRYLVVGGLAFIYHAKPRFTKDIDLWIEPTRANIEKANRALVDFGSPALLDLHRPRQILQIGVAPNRIDLLQQMSGMRFTTAWRRRVRSRYGRAPANWIHLDDLLRIKSLIPKPRHQEDARVLREVKRMKRRR